MTNTKAHGFNPARSQVNTHEMMDFLRAPITGNLEEVPGIGPVNAKHLKDTSTGEAITTTHQLIGTYLSFKSQDVTQQEHHDKVWHYLQSRGLNSHRSGVIDAIASKVNLMMPGVYNHAEFRAANVLEKVATNENAAPVVNDSATKVTEQQPDTTEATA